MSHLISLSPLTALSKHISVNTAKQLCRFLELQLYCNAWAKCKQDRPQIIEQHPSIYNTYKPNELHKNLRDMKKDPKSFFSLSLAVGQTASHLTLEYVETKRTTLPCLKLVWGVDVHILPNNLQCVPVLCKKKRHCSWSLCYAQTQLSKLPKCLPQKVIVCFA